MKLNCFSFASQDEATELTQIAAHLDEWRAFWVVSVSLYWFNQQMHRQTTTTAAAAAAAALMHTRTSQSWGPFDSCECCKVPLILPKARALMGPRFVGLIFLQILRATSSNLPTG